MTDGDQPFLKAVGDEDCTAIMSAVRDEAKTVTELSEECDVPLSTAYRKVNRLQDAGLIEEKNRLGRDYKPKNVYEQSFEAAVITLSEDGGFEVEFVDSSMERVSTTSIDDRPRLQPRSD